MSQTLAPGNPDKLAYVTQTTLSVDDTRDVIEALKIRFPKIAGPDVKDICYATQNRQAAVRKLSETVDLILVVGAQNSSNSNRLRETRRRGRHPQLSRRRGRRGRSRLVRRCGGGRADRRRLDAGAAGRRGDRPAARDRAGRPVDHGRHRRAYPLQAARRVARRLTPFGGRAPHRTEAPGNRARPSVTDSRQAATAARRSCGALAEAPAGGRLP